MFINSAGPSRGGLMVLDGPEAFGWDPRATPHHVVYQQLQLGYHVGFDLACFDAAPVTTTTTASSAVVASTAMAGGGGLGGWGGAGGLRLKDEDMSSDDVWLRGDEGFMMDESCFVAAGSRPLGIGVSPPARNNHQQHQHQQQTVSGPVATSIIPFQHHAARRDAAAAGHAFARTSLLADDNIFWPSLPPSMNEQATAAALPPARGASRWNVGGGEIAVGGGPHFQQGIVYHDHPDSLLPDATAATNMGSGGCCWGDGGDYAADTAGSGSVYGSFSSSAGGASDLMDSMTLGDNNGGIGSPWSPAAAARHSGGQLVGMPGSAAGITSASPAWGAVVDPNQPHSHHSSAMDMTTVSPKLLRIRQSPTPPPLLSSSSDESVRTSFMTSLAPNTAAANQAKLYVATAYGAATEAAAAGGRTRSAPTKQARKQLPDTRPRYVPILPSDAANPRSSQMAAAHSNSSNSSNKKRGSSNNNCSSSNNSSSTNRSAAGRSKSSKGSDNNPSQTRLLRVHEGGGLDIVDRSPAMALETLASGGLDEERVRKDEFLVASKRAGMTYKEIRRKGGFTEAESTLRGRYRTLTKHKEARVRKPEWEEIDDLLLRRAVRKLAKGDDGNKISWKQVGEYIVSNGGSYHFGNTTCRKRWDMLVAQDRAAAAGPANMR